ncbi:MAG TPA: ABC transporter substrate-binding protein [Acidimicrobiales bacterium]|nr:ABC transporter substrate-binding protein [Acidimicrobiales bacterium]
MTLTAVSLGTAGASASNSPFNVLMIAGTTGPVAPPTQAEIQATKAAASVINHEGGIDGHKIAVKEVNDNLDPTTALSELQQAESGSAKPNLVFAGTTSNETLAMLPTLTRDKTLSMELAGSGVFDSPYQFALPNYLPNQATALVNAIKKQYPNAKKIGIAITNDAFGTSLLQSYEPAITKAGLTYVVQTFSDTATDVTPELQTLQAANPDVLIASGYGAIGGYIIQDRANLGWTVPTIGDGAESSNDLPAMVPASALDGVSLIAQAPSVYKPLSQESKAFQTFWKATALQGSKFTQSIVLYTLSYDDLMLVYLAAKQAHSTSSTAIANALEHLKQPKVKPYVTWSTEGFTPKLHVEQAPATDYVLASAYTKDGMALPFGSK